MKMCSPRSKAHKLLRVCTRCTLQISSNCSSQSSACNTNQRPFVRWKLSHGKPVCHIAIFTYMFPRSSTDLEANSYTEQ